MTHDPSLAADDDRQHPQTFDSDGFAKTFPSDRLLLSSFLQIQIIVCTDSVELPSFDPSSAIDVLTSDLFSRICAIILIS